LVKNTTVSPSVWPGRTCSAFTGSPLSQRLTPSRKVRIGSARGAAGSIFMPIEGISAPACMRLRTFSWARMAAVSAIPAFPPT